MNLTSFMGNEVLNIFLSNNFFEKTDIFEENGEKNFAVHDHFFKRRGQMDITFFIKN